MIKLIFIIGSILLVIILFTGALASKINSRYEVEGNKKISLMCNDYNWAAMKMNNMTNFANRIFYINLTKLKIVECLKNEKND